LKIRNSIEANITKYLCETRGNEKKEKENEKKSEGNIYFSHLELNKKK